MGRGLRKVAPATIAIEWAYGTEAQPDIRAHRSHNEAWLRYWDMYNNEKRERIGRAQEKTFRRIEETRRRGINTTTGMGSAMSACTNSLINVKICPKAPNCRSTKLAGTMKSIRSWMASRQGASSTTLRSVWRRSGGKMVLRGMQRVR